MNRTDNQFVFNRTDNQFVFNRTDNQFVFNRTDNQFVSNRTDNQFVFNRTNDRFVFNRTNDRFVFNRTNDRFVFNRTVIRLFNSKENIVNHSYFTLGSILGIDRQKTKTIVLTSSEDKEDWFTSTIIKDDVHLLMSCLEKLKDKFNNRRMILIINLFDLQSLELIKEFLLHPPFMSIDILVNVEYHCYQSNIRCHIDYLVCYIITDIPMDSIIDTIWKQLNQEEQYMLASKETLLKCFQDKHTLVISHMTHVPLYFTLPYMK